MEKLSDIELVELCQKGDSTAFEKLADRHYMLVYRVAYKWCGVRVMAEDITQEVFVKLARAINGFKGESDFKTWLYRITVNAARDMQRKDSRKIARESAYTEEKFSDMNSEGEHIDAGKNEDSKALYQALGTLSPKLKETVILVLAEGLSHKEAAVVLGCAETTVSWRVFKARGKLQRLLVSEV